MKKLLVVAFAICVCPCQRAGSLTGTSTPSNSSTTHAAAPIITVSTQSSCQVLHDRQALLTKDYQTVSAQYISAQAGRNWQQAGEAEKTLMRLHQSIAQMQTQLKAC